MPKILRPIHEKGQVSFRYIEQGNRGGGSVGSRPASSGVHWASCADNVTKPIGMTLAEFNLSRAQTAVTFAGTQPIGGVIDLQKLVDLQALAEKTAAERAAESVKEKPAKQNRLITPVFNKPCR